MMPTRLQDGLSVSLLQWMRSADPTEKRTILVRLIEGESLTGIEHNLRNAGMDRIEHVSAASLRGTVTPDVLSRVVRSLGVCAVTDDAHKDPTP